MGLGNWIRSTREELSLAMKARRAWKAIEKENAMGHDWNKTLAAVGKDFVVTSIAALVAFFAVPDNLAAVLGALTPEMRAALIPLISALLVMARKYIKHSAPPSAGPDMKAGALAGAVGLLLLCSPAIAQEPSPSPTPAGDAMTWLAAHSSIISGTYSTDTSDREEFIGLRIAGEFDLAPRLTGWAQVDLFTRSRDGNSATPALPSSPAGLAVYSSGEVRVGAYRTLTGRLSAECLAGATFPMPSLSSGASVDPLDGVKILGGCGLRVGTRDTYARAVAGHFGPVVDNGNIAGFVPAASLSARVPLRAHIALAPELSIGRNTLAQRTTYAARIAFVAF